MGISERFLTDPSGGGVIAFLPMIFSCKLVLGILKRRPAPGDTPYREVLVRWGGHPGDNLVYFVTKVIKNSPNDDHDKSIT